MTNEKHIYTIGHSKHPIEKFLALLKLHKVEILVDVRTYPMSRFSPHFNKKRLEQSLAEASVKYLFMGEDLGGRPEGEQFYDEDGRTLYYKMAQTAGFQDDLRQIFELCKTQRVAIMCSEEDPNNCHRRLLIAKAMFESAPDVTLHHIRTTGAIQEETAANVADGLKPLSTNIGDWRSPKPPKKK